MIQPHLFKKNIFQLNGDPHHQFPDELIPDWFKHAAVLILFWEDNSEIRVVLTERSKSVRSHKGEVSFPGGKRESGETLVQTALREAEEEIGINLQHVEVTGQLDDAWSRAAYHLFPFVGWYHGVPEFNAQTSEVGKILTPTVDELLDETRHKDKTVSRGDLKFTIKTVRYRESTIFGLTADLLFDALDLGLGKRRERGIKRERELKKALENRFFAYQKSNGQGSPQSDTMTRHEFVKE